MTNEEFIDRVWTFQDEKVMEHAKKLVAIVEANKKCFHRMAELGLDEEDDFDNLMVLLYELKTALPKEP